MWLRSDTCGEEGCSQSFYVVGVWGVDAVFDFLRDLSPPRKETSAVSGARVDPAGLFHAADVAHDSGGGDCAVDYRDVATGVAGAVRQASADCALDTAFVVLCVGNGSDHLFYGVPDLCAEVGFAFFKLGRENQLCF